MYKNKANS